MGRVPEPHASPKAPDDRPWDWHGKAETEKSDAIIEAGGWPLFADAHAWHDPSQDAQGDDPPNEKGRISCPTMSSSTDVCAWSGTGRVRPWVS